MFGKHVSQLNYSDIISLVLERKEREGYHLDFKGDIAYPDKAKKEIAKDISAFANSAGGYLIFGVSKDYEVVGINTIIQNKPIDEWLNQVLSTNIEPSVFYFDPKIITIPGSEKCIVIIQIPESLKRPHIVTEINNYYFRINDSSKTATHNQIRDMFEFSKNRNNEFEDFIKARNLDKEIDPQFGLIANSIQLTNDIKEKLQRSNPLVLYSFIPKYIQDEKLVMPFQEFHDWLQQNEKGYAPAHGMHICYSLYDCEIGLDNVVSVHKANNKPTSYFEIQNNGFVEAGVSKAVAEAFSDHTNNLQVYVNATGIIGYEMMLLGFAKKFYSLIKYYDDVLFQLSFVNMLNYTLINLNDKYRFPDHRTPKNTQHDNFKIRYQFNPLQLTEARIVEIAKTHAEKICRAFGFEKDYCFVNNELTLKHMHYFRL